MKKKVYRSDPQDSHGCQMTFLVLTTLFGAFLLLLGLFGLFTPGSQRGALAILAFAIVFSGLGVWGIRDLRERTRLPHEAVEIDSMDGVQFEHYVAGLLRSRGFHTAVTSPSHDLGVDIIAQIGSTKYAVQVKRQVGGVSRRAVSDAVAGKAHYGCNKAMVVTNGYFTAGAEKLAKSTGCELADRLVLMDWVAGR